MADEKKNNKPKNSEVNEPAAEYVAQTKLGDVFKTITISSLEEMDNDNYRHWNSLTPEERFAEHYEMISRMYRDELEKSKGTLFDKIYFHE